MIFSRNGNVITITLENDEPSVADWITVNHGTEYLQNFIKAHLDQRSRQKDYDKLQGIHKAILSMAGNDKAIIQQQLDNVLNNATAINNKVVP